MASLRTRIHPATVTDHFLGTYDQRSPREKKAETFLDLTNFGLPNATTAQIRGRIRIRKDKD